MKLDNLPKLAISAPSKIVTYIADKDEALIAFIKANDDVKTVLTKLYQEEKYALFIRFLALALAKREAVWWACVCSHQTVTNDSPTAIQMVLQAAKNWVRQPDETHRRAAETAALQAGYDHPASWAALAAFWSQGSITAPDTPVVEAAYELTGQAVAGSVLLAGVISEPEKSVDKYQRFIQQGINIAQGGDGNID